MPIFPDIPTDEVLALINTSNSSLPVALSSANARFGAPAAVTPAGGTIQNTSLQIAATPGSDYQGSVFFKYRRRSLTSLFRSQPVMIALHSTAGPSASPYNISDLIPLINSLYGMNFTATDYVDAALPVGSTTNSIAPGIRVSQIQVQAGANSLSYVDSFTLYWLQSPGQVSAIFPQPANLAGRTYPDGQSSGAPAIAQGDFLFYGLNCTAIASNLAGMNGLVWNQEATGAQLTNQNAIVAFLRNARPDLNISSLSANNSGGLGSTHPAVVALPSTVMPWANSTKYLDMLILPTVNTAWFQGDILLHYNLR